MNTRLKWIVMVLAASGLGIAMPDCGGTQALQQQIEEVVAKQRAQTDKAKGIETQIKAVSEGVTKVTEEVKNLATLVQAQQNTITQLETQLKELAAKKTAPAPKPAAKPTAKKKTGR